MAPCYVLWRKPQRTCPSDIHRHLGEQGGRVEGLDIGISMEPSGKGSFQAAKLHKVRPDYRVQSLHKGHGRHAFHQIQV